MSERTKRTAPISVLVKQLGASEIEIRRALDMMRPEEQQVFTRIERTLALDTSTESLRTRLANAIAETGNEHPIVEHILSWWLHCAAKTYEDFGIIFRNAAPSSPVHAEALKRLTRIGIAAAKEAPSFEAVWRLLEYAPVTGHLTEVIVRQAIHRATNERNLDHLRTIWNLLERFFDGNELQALCLQAIEETARLELLHVTRHEKLMQIFHALPWQTAARVRAIQQIADHLS